MQRHLPAPIHARDLRDHPVHSAVVATAMDPSLSHRTWSIGGAERQAMCHAFLVVQGSAVFAAAGGSAIALAAPSLLWLPRSVRGEFRLEAGSQGSTCAIAEEIVWRSVGDSPVQADLRPLLERIVVAAADRLAPHIGELDTAFAALVRESRGQEAGASAMMGLYLGLLLLHLWRASGVAPAAGLRGTGVTVVQRFRQLVELHYRENLGIDAFARALGVTRAHLHEACLRGTGRTPLKLLHERLIEEARLRLEQTQMPVEQVGYSLGFRDAGYFNRFFKRLTGHAPGAHRLAAAAARPSNEPPSFAAWP